MAQYLLDTDICVAFLKGKNNLLEKTEKVGFDNCHVSEITIGELTYGAYYSDRIEKHKEEVIKTKKLFQIVPIFECLDFFGKEKAKLRREGNLIHDFDLLIGATAVHFDMIMVTNNEKHLSRISGIKIENWIKNEVK
ncbi:type II toxin-antitoxin system VapC family toxin [Phaeodactylibacter xiamenensis]|uniref:DNA-binding protein n=1 Tax=Phaeodactylibacter xiamenensis TaxID=1524460 RepID=A0A098RYC1_9BACT|nr:type II toxin-antitoxin system VapC family toxin [Phaeodactylibacter xiamenensis]KGE84915.1 DNA-binding protein [Phaeodactylibacter xiamenensis]